MLKVFNISGNNDLHIFRQCRIILQRVLKIAEVRPKCLDDCNLWESDNVNNLANWVSFSNTFLWVDSFLNM
jgi:hypothetical protein